MGNLGICCSGFLLKAMSGSFHPINGIKALSVPNHITKSQITAVKILNQTPNNNYNTTEKFQKF